MRSPPSSRRFETDQDGRDPVPAELDSAKAINAQVDRLLRAADAYGRYPTPVEDIIAQAELTEANDYVFDESLIKKAPAYIRAILRSARQKIQGLVDRRARVIHVSPGIEHVGKRRFVQLHEVTHHILPHQQDLLFADDHETLSAATRRLFEQEANQGAAELLFQRERFSRDAADLQVSVAAIWDLANRYGSSFHAAVRRYAETHPGVAAAVVLERTPRSMAPPTWRREEVASTPNWRARFGAPSWPRLMAASDYPFLAALDHPELDEISLPDIDGELLQVKVEAFQTPYKSFVLLWVSESRRLFKPRRVRLAN